ncbi:MAG: hypothetical protein JOZ87_09645 [Chloroflexi bacterium]|nr:hypothetical protein [Chloroflexota bacterium]
MTTKSGRLLTLTGTGGTGKTRLAVAIAEALRGAARFPHGVWFADLSPIRDRALVLPSIARLFGVREQLNQPLVALMAALNSRELLLLLDNFEQVVGAAPEIAALLDVCPGAAVLATSREPLRVRWEQEFPVAPLPLPNVGYDDTPTLLMRNPAVALFVQRAQAVEPDFALSEDNAHAVAELCIRLDGLPLAIELAAARCRLLPPAALVTRLERRLDLLRARRQDVPPRHQTLREAIDWSYELLTPAEQLLFRRLAAFAGGCRLEAVEWVGGPDAAELAESLLDKSLLVPVHEQGEHRFRMLETIREYARDRLDATDESSDIQDAHSRWMLVFAEQANTGLRGPNQVRWIRRIELELDNLRVALRWCLDAGAYQRAARLLYVTAIYWWVRGLYAECRRWAEELLATNVNLAREARAQVQFVAGEMAFLQGDVDRAPPLLEDALEGFSATGDFAGAGMVLGLLAFAASGTDLGRAEALLLESAAAFHSVQDTWGEAWALQGRAGMLLATGELAAARDVYQTSLRLSRDCGDVRGIAQALDGLAFVAVTAEEVVQAAAYWRESVPLSLEVGHQELLVYGLRGLARVMLLTGQATRATRLLGAAQVVLERATMGDWPIRRELSERTQAEARAQLGDAAFEAAWTIGGGLAVEEAIHEALASAAAVVSPVASDRTPERATQLTPREREVARLIAHGLTSPQIAEVLIISQHTADAHADNIRGKLGLRSRAEIAAWATEHGLRTGTVEVP